MECKRFSRAMASAIMSLVAAIAGGCKPAVNPPIGKVLPYFQPDPVVDRTFVDYKRLGPNEFRIFLTNTPTVEAQKNPSWCWAASSASLLNYENQLQIPAQYASRRSNVPPPRARQARNVQVPDPVAQDDIIRQMAAHKADQSAGEADVLAALAQEMAPAYLIAKTRFEKRPHKEGIFILNTASTNSGYFQASLPRLPSADQMVDQLSIGHPLIVAIDPEQGELGHVVVLTGVRFSMAATNGQSTQGGYFIREIETVDPHDGKPASFKAFTDNPGNERNAIDRIAFAVSRPLAQQFFKDSIKAYDHPVWIPPNPSPPAVPVWAVPKNKK